MLTNYNLVLDVLNRHHTAVSSMKIGDFSFKKTCCTSEISNITLKLALLVPSMDRLGRHATFASVEPKF